MLRWKTLIYDTQPLPDFDSALSGVVRFPLFFFPTIMPFAKYLQPDAQQSEPSTGSYYASDTLQLQIPQFMYGGPPTLAPGGGAEVLSAGMFSNGSAASSWFTNNGFNTPKFTQQSCVSIP